MIESLVISQEQLLKNTLQNFRQSAHEVFLSGLAKIFL